jgi:uncharacterized protein with HEPN domain
MKDPRLQLNHMLNCIESVRCYAASSPEALCSGRMTRSATLWDLTQITLCARGLPVSLKAKHPEIDRSALRVLGRQLLDVFREVDFERVWWIVEDDLWNLAETTRMMIEELRAD